MNIIRKINIIMLSSVIVLMTACYDLSDLAKDTENDVQQASEGGVMILCEGNFNAGNASLSYYNPETRTVENGVFHRANDRKLGDTGQSILVYGDRTYIAMENSGIIWGLNTADFKVNGQLTATADTKITNPRYVHLTDADKAYVTDLYSPYINIFNPKTFEYLGAIDVSQVQNNGYCSTEEMVQYGDEVFTNCWSYSNKILIINTKTDKVAGEIELSSWQPKSIRLDRNGKLWVITDGGYSTDAGSFANQNPHLYRIDAVTRSTELDIELDSDETNTQLAMNSTADVIYIMNNDIYRMNVNADHIPSEPFIKALTDSDGKRHKLYGIGINPQNNEIYVADAVDYRQSGVVFRYAIDGTLIDQFRVGITPNHFAFIDTDPTIPQDEQQRTEEEQMRRALVSKVFEYMPAPGHQVNGYTVVGDFIHDGATMEEACDSVLSHFQHTWMVSLGGQGGYVIAGFDHNVTNSHGDYDLAIKGNPYSYQSEPGIIWVSMDENGNGIPDDTWYELKGSEYGTENETLDYAITYYKPTTPGQDIEWTDNQGGSGIVPYMSEWNQHDSYWQDWVPTQTDAQGREYRTYYGSRLKDTHTYINGYTHEPPFDWGYADNNGDDYRRLRGSIMSAMVGCYKLSNAVNANGEPANLPYINFVKVQTGQTGWSPNLGEISTEVYGIWDAHLLMK